MKLDLDNRLTTKQKAVLVIPFLIALVVAPYCAYKGTLGMSLSDKISAHSFFLIAGFIFAGFVALIIGGVFAQNTYLRKRDEGFAAIKAAYDVDIPRGVLASLMNLRIPTKDFRVPNASGVLVKYTATFFDEEFRLYDANGIEEGARASALA